MISEIKEALSALKEQLILAEKVEQNKSEIVKLRQDFDKLEENFAKLIEKVYKLLEKHTGQIEKEFADIREKNAKDHEIQLLKISNELLRSTQPQPGSRKKLKS
jgi:predicted nuclease with TOPRIM domain